MNDRYADADVVVVGAGVSGLTAALLLLRAGFPVRIVARDLPAHTTSCNAGAIWGPHLVGHPRVEQWSATSLRVLTGLAARSQVTGVRLVTGTEAAAEDVAPPVWMRALDSFAPAAVLPTGFKVGWRYQVPIIDMPVYLRYLTNELAGHGVSIEQRSIGELADEGRIVVNCTGMGSHDLAHDDALKSVRGDLLRIRNPGITEFFAEHTDREDDQTYILPQGEYVLLGGTAYPEGSLVPSPDVIEKGIIDRCVAVDPRVAGQKVLQHRVGYRPNRAMIRLEAEDAGASTIIHNYGHGGGGVTLSWGCAEDVLSEVRKLVAAQTAPANA